MEQGFYNPATYNSTSCVPNGGGTSTSACQYCFDDWADISPSSPIPDAADKMAMEKAYFDALHKKIESTYCVDKNRQFFTGYSSGGWLAQQLGCWFPDVLRAQGNVTGGLPPVLKTNVTGVNDYCVQHPIPGFLIHNNPDTSNAFQGSVDAASRLFALNGCTGTFSPPPLPSSTAALPDGLQEYTITGVPNTGSFRCYQYTTCPAESPIVFCVSTDSLHTNTQATRAVPGFWEFFSKL
jgi:poly(3-hydroxybutyrate) depolymerase